MWEEVHEQHSPGRGGGSGALHMDGMSSKGPPAEESLSNECRSSSSPFTLLSGSGLGRGPEIPC